MPSTTNHASGSTKKVCRARAIRTSADTVTNTGTPREITFKVYRDEDGVLCATGVDHRLYTSGKTYNKLIKNINDIVELFFSVPHTSITINLKFEAQENSSAETAAC